MHNQANHGADTYCYARFCVSLPPLNTKTLSSVCVEGALELFTIENEFSEGNEVQELSALVAFVLSLQKSRSIYVKFKKTINECLRNEYTFISGSGVLRI